MRFAAVPSTPLAGASCVLGCHVPAPWWLGFWWFVAPSQPGRRCYGEYEEQVIFSAGVTLG
ncbi:MAG TPA: hypothetical protein VII23_13915 [Terriglobales bacterium]